MANNADFGIKWDLLVSDAWSDANLKQRLLNDPASVLGERGIEVPAGVSVKIHASTDSERHLVIPTAPAEEELSEEQLTAVAGGHSVSLSAHACGGGCGGHSRQSGGHHSGGHFC